VIEYDEVKKSVNLAKHGLDLVYTKRGGNVRAISLRRASKTERRKLYEQAK